MRYIPVATLILVVTGYVVVAKEAKIGSASINLTAPAGYCELDETKPSDARLVKAIGSLVRGGGNDLLGMYADCGQLSDWRVRKRPLLDDIAQYQSPLNMANQPLPGPPEQLIKQNCASLRAEGEKLLSGILPDTKSRIETTLNRVKLNESSFIGVLAEEPTACYAALLQKLKTEVGTEKTQVALFAITIVKGKMVFYYLFSPFSGADAVTAMLAKHKTNVAALLAANGN